MTELKPCPFCGGKAELITEYLVIGLAVTKVQCTSCESSTALTNRKKAIAIWNRRVNK